MSEMIERLADVIWNEHSDQPFDKDDALRTARAVLEALREPTKEQAIAGQDALDDCVDSGWDSDADGNRYDYTHISASAPAEVWRAMIDAALTDPSPANETPEDMCECWAREAEERKT